MVSPEELARAAELIRRGGLVAFPTETVYGLGANALDADAVRRIFEVKGRPASSPLIVHVADEAMARMITLAWPESAQLLVARFWPGPLTLVLPKAAMIPDVVTAGFTSVGVRVPAHPVALELIRLAGVPIAAPSANRFMAISPTRAEHVRQGLGDTVDMVVDGGPTSVGIESTVVSLLTEKPIVLRVGMITQEEMEEVVGKTWGQQQTPTDSNSPGLHPRHYSPHTPFFLLNHNEARPPGRGRVLKMPSDPTHYAASLYAELHCADGEGLEWIAVETPPDEPEWAGILDRLKRASFRA